MKKIHSAIQAVILVGGFPVLISIYCVILHAIVIVLTPATYSDVLNCAEWCAVATIISIVMTAITYAVAGDIKDEAKK